MKKTVLLVEDDHLDRDTATEVFKAAQADVAAFPNAEAALQYLRGWMDASASRADLALVVMDITLSNLSGMECLREIRALSELRGVPVVMVTGSQQDANKYVSYRLGANAYLVKPDTAGGYRKMLEATADFWLRLNTRPS